VQHLPDLVKLATRLQYEGKPFAVATLVKKEGSTYRQPGARLLVQADGHTHGMVSGGCLRGEVVQEGLSVLQTGSAVVRSYDLTTENILLGYGAGCHGVAHLLIERGDGGLSMLRSCLDHRQPAVLAHVIGCPTDTRLLGARQLLKEGEPIQTSPNWPSALHLREPISSEVQTHETAEGMLEIFLEIIRPPLRLIIFGSGPDVAPLVHIARALGWSTEVVGSRPVTELRERIPGATAYIFLMHPEAVLERVTVDSRTAVVVMNHNQGRDAALVNVLLAGPAPYVGVLGPRARCETLVNCGSAPPPEKMFGPVGLDIGAETPEEIALSIAAEIQTVFSGHVGGFLRDKRGEIHA